MPKKLTYPINNPAPSPYKHYLAILCGKTLFVVWSRAFETIADAQTAAQNNLFPINEQFIVSGLTRVQRADRATAS